MVRPHKTPLANTTLELLLPRMSPFMPRQLVRTREPPSTVLPLALVGFLPSVFPTVGLEMRRLEVILIATFESAFVYPAASRRRRLLRRWRRQQEQLRGDESRAAVRGHEERVRLMWGRELGGDGGQDDFGWRRLRGRLRSDLRRLRRFFAGVFAVHEDLLLASAHFKFEAFDDVENGLDWDGAAGAGTVLVGMHYDGEGAGLFWGRRIAEEVAGQLGLIPAEALLRRVFYFFAFGV